MWQRGIAMKKYVLEWNGDEILNNAIRAAELGLDKSALHLKEKSSNQAPVDKGDLKGDCAIEKTSLKRRVGYILQVK